MLQRLKALFLVSGAAGEADKTGGHGHDERTLAVAVLLVEAARMDGDFDAGERARIHALLGERLDLGVENADSLIDAAVEIAAAAVDHWSFARVIKNGFDYDERVELVEMLWQVAYADGVLHDYEASLLRRITGLLYVSDLDSGAARKRALGSLGIAAG